MRASPRSVVEKEEPAAVAGFPIGGYTLVSCGEQLVAFGGWVAGAAARQQPGARPQTAPAGRARAAGGVQASNALYAFDLAKQQWRELAAETATPPPRAGHACCATGEHSLLVLGGTGSSHRKLGDAWSLQLQRTDTSQLLRMEMRVEAWTAERAKQERQPAWQAAAFTLLAITVPSARQVASGAQAALRYPGVPPEQSCELALGVAARLRPLPR